MNFASLPVLLYVLPVFSLLTAISHPHWKPDALALGGLCLVWVTGGFPALILLGLSVSLTWLVLRLSPRETKKHRRRARIWLTCGIFLQILLLLLARLLLGSQPLLPLLLCTLQGTECLCAHTKGRMKIPPLLTFFCYQCDMTRLPGGPVLQYPAYGEMLAGRSVSGKRLGQGASLCIRGLFLLVCLSLPMQAIHAEMASGGLVRTALDAVMLMLVFYMTLYYRLKGTAQIGQGIALMLGYTLPDSFDQPILADSMQNFWSRFLVPMHDWAKRVLLPDDAPYDPAGYFAKTALLFGGIGLLFGSGVCGLIWGVCTAAYLTFEYTRKKRKKHAALLPAAARSVLTAAAVLLGMGMMGSRTPVDAFGCYTALLCFNGIPLSERTAYLLTTNWVPFMIALAGLFPLKKLLPEPSGWSRWLRMFCQPAAELVMLLFSFAELLSRYLRP